MSDMPLPTTRIDPQAESHLVQIPLEILIRITYFISTVDLGNVRLSCKALEQSLFNFFSHEFFRKKQFMVTTDSLQALVDISKHPTLSPCLKHVIISTDRPTNYWVSGISDEGRARLEVALADHMSLLVTGGLRDMLVEAFSNLVNLDTVDIRDFNSPSRNRDGLGTHWRSYGAVALASATEAPVEPSRQGQRADDEYPTQLFSAVTAALAAADARPRSLEVLLRTGTWAPFGLDHAAFYIPPRLTAPVSALLANLQSLHLTLNLTNRKTRMKPFIIQRFLSLASNLTWLRLNFSSTDMADVEHLFQWLARKDSHGEAASFDMPQIQLPHLERLDLGNAATEAPMLIGLVDKFAPTLTSLYLRRVNLHDKDKDAVLDTSRINPWERCLSVIARLPDLRLRVIELSSVTHSCMGWKGAVSFKDAQMRSPSTNWTCSTNQVTLAQAVAQAIEAMTVQWPQESDPDAMEDDSDEDEEEVDDDEDEEEGASDGE
ncbi:hypothetical protein N658DRAFT_501599 [Parathielavia hyrcaniae]|uniref:F-box domain-containing protein n=1 Tax=Parathielavia hyrcaniae TaxID=113614 RepID=A0AAN6PSV9_9PEZI|nr:hypothetical protein N658DRAFT_501599 [Parathielavia hyrcaniae]